jgi:hypothetical protein
MIIILEGADGTGKTTLAKAICKELEAHYIHATWSRELDCRMLEYQMNILSEAFENYHKTGKPTIIDRLWLSESVYGEIYRSGSKFPYHGRIIEQFINSIGGFTIICLVKDKLEHKLRFEKLKKERFEMYEDIEKVVDLYTFFYCGCSNINEIKEQLNNSYMREVILMGGAGKLHDHIGKTYFSYNIEDDGDNLDLFCRGVKYELQRRIHEH